MDNIKYMYREKIHILYHIMHINYTASYDYFIQCILPVDNRRSRTIMKD